MEKKFYSKFLYTFLMLWFISMLAGILSTILFMGELPAWDQLGYPILGLILLSLALTSITIPLYPVIVRPEGIKTYNFWGSYSTITWEDIVSTSSFNMLGLCYITFRTKRNKTLYIPRFLSNFPGLRDQVAAWAGQQHLLTKALSSS